MDIRCRIELLGWLRVEQNGRIVSRFQTQQTGSLLAYLACFSDRSHPRPVLIEKLWPEEMPASGQKKLRQALFSLRKQLEPPGVPAGAVLMADRTSVQLNPDVVTTDVADFDAACAAGLPTGRGVARDAPQVSGVERERHLITAVELYHGDLLPGLFDEWIMPERQRLAESCLQALDRLVALREAARDPAGAIRWARRAVSVDPLREESYRTLIRLLAASGRPDAALSGYRELERLLRQELSAAPEAALRALARELEQQAALRPLEITELGEEREREEQEKPPLLSEEPVTPVAPPPPPQMTHGGNLPPRLNRFFGREEELSRLSELLIGPSAICRLVTLTGPGGSGKTRLAVELARSLIEPSAGPTPAPACWFVPLAAATDSHRIAGAMRDAMRLPHSPDTEPFEQVVAALSAQPTILLLDNFEHLLPDGALIVRRLLERVEPLTVLVTSRRRLELEGERAFPVSPLPVPVDGSSLRVEGPTKTTSSDPSFINYQLSTLAQCASIQLFVDRAQAVVPDFQVTRTNAQAVAELCCRLEGIPLAIELAAARIKMLPPAQLLERLSKRFDLLVSRRRDAAPRHQSLRAAIEWSYQLLSPDLQDFFCRLSVFRGGWTLEVAETVCKEPGAIEFLEQLCECSLVIAPAASESGHGVPVSDQVDLPVPAITEHPPEAEPRFRLLETLREYAAEQFLQRGEREQVREQHARFFQALAEQGARRLTGHEQAEWLVKLEAEHDNLRAALAWAIEWDLPSGVRLAEALHEFWRIHGHWSEEEEWLGRCLAHCGDAATPWRAKALIAAGRARLRQGDSRGAAALFAESSSVCGQLEDRGAVATAYRCLGQAAFARGDLAEASDCYERSLALWRELEDKEGMAEVLRCLAGLALDQGDLVRAQDLAAESVALWQEPGDGKGESLALATSGGIARARGDVARERSCYEQRLAIAREFDTPASVAALLVNLGPVAALQGDVEAAGAFLGESLAIYRRLGDTRGIAQCLFSLATVARDQVDRTREWSLYEEIIPIYRASGELTSLCVLLDRMGVVKQHGGDLASARALHEESLAIGRRLEDRRCIERAVVRLGCVALAQGDLARAMSLCQECLRIARAMGSQAHVVLRLEEVADVAIRQGEAQRGVRLLGAAAALRETGGIPLPASRVDRHRAVLERAHSALDEATFTMAWAAGRAMTVGQAISLALGEAEGTPAAE